MRISEIETRELVEELKKRSGVNIEVIEPYTEKIITVEGPMIVLKIID